MSRDHNRRLCLDRLAQNSKVVASERRRSPHKEAAEVRPRAFEHRQLPATNQPYIARTGYLLETGALINRVACPSCDVTILDMKNP